MRTRSGDGRNLLHVGDGFSSSYITKYVIDKIETKLGLLVLKDMLGERNEAGRTPREQAEYYDDLGTVEILDAVMKKFEMLDWRN
jgi:hypothetical protein